MVGWGWGCMGCVCIAGLHSVNLHLSATRTSGYNRVDHIAVWSPFILGSNTIGRKQRLR
ncbi:hypothetical protein PR002_g30379 [Phytophthora rubi]|uniref:Secreted protein n=1 Tax=Phytophthora rubi TaxID=129364 RepID=A0A6A3GSI3_9STRA|nr:hypothetical protein PR002_g30379 [Phytophthora rubi]